ECGRASLCAFGRAQPASAPADRVARAPSGDRVPVGEVEMPAADGLVLLAAHLGEGIFLLDRLDPSVIDEASPTAVNPRLDMYDRGTATARWRTARRATRPTSWPHSAPRSARAASASTA